MVKIKKVVEDTQTCGQCKYFRTDLPSNPAGYCYRYPPTVVIFEDGDLSFERPVVERTEYCGEFIRITQ